MGVPEMVDAVEKRAELFAVVGDAADRRAVEAGAVIAALAADEPDPVGRAALAVVGERDLERRVHCLGTGIGEEDMVEVAEKHGREPRSKAEGAGVAPLEGRSVIKLPDLLAHRGDDPFPSVPGIDAPHAGRAVQNPAAVICDIVHALGGNDDARSRLELAVRCERHPERLKSVHSAPCNSVTIGHRLPSGVLQPRLAISRLAGRCLGLRAWRGAVPAGM